MPGFGSGPFGIYPFGEWPWSKRTFYDYIPLTYRQQDEASGRLLEKFIDSVRPLFDELRRDIRDIEVLRDPLRVPTAYDNVLSFKLGPVVTQIGALLQRGRNASVDALGQFVAPNGRFNDFSIGKELTISKSSFTQNNRSTKIASVVNSTTVITEDVLAPEAGPLTWDLREVVEQDTENVSLEIRSGDANDIAPNWILNDGSSDFVVSARRQFPLVSENPLSLIKQDGTSGTIDGSGVLTDSNASFTQKDVGRLISISTSTIDRNNNRWEIKEVQSGVQVYLENQDGDSPAEDSIPFYWSVLPHAIIKISGQAVPAGVIEREGLAGELLTPTTFTTENYGFEATDVGKVISIRGSAIPANNTTVTIESVTSGIATISESLTVDTDLAWEMRSATANDDPTAVTIRSKSLIGRLAFDYGLQIDTQESEARQRSWVANVSRWTTRKGTAKAYDILAKISGWVSEALPQYRISYDVYQNLPVDVTNLIGEGAANRAGSDGEFSIVLGTIRFSSEIAEFRASDEGLLLLVADSTSGNDGLYEIYGFIDSNTVELHPRHSITIPETNNGNLRWSLVRAYSEVAPLLPNFDDFNPDYMEDLIDGYDPQSTNNFGIDVYCWEDGWDSDIGVVIDSATLISPGIWEVVVSDGPAQGPSSVVGSAAAVNLKNNWSITDSSGSQFFLETDPVDLGGTYSFRVASIASPATGAATMSYLCKEITSGDYCRSNRIVLELTPDTINSESGVAIEKARERLLKRLEDVTPAHVVLVVRFVQILDASLTITAQVIKTDALLNAPVTAYYDEYYPADVIVDDGTGASTATHTTDTEADTPYTDLGIVVTITTP